MLAKLDVIEDNLRHQIEFSSDTVGSADASLAQEVPARSDDSQNAALAHSFSRSYTPDASESSTQRRDLVAELDRVEADLRHQMNSANDIVGAIDASLAQELPIRADDGQKGALADKFSLS